MMIKKEKELSPKATAVLHIFMAAKLLGTNTLTQDEVEAICAFLHDLPKLRKLSKAKKRLEGK
jgi:hypothetical protein